MSRRRSVRFQPAEEEEEESKEEGVLIEHKTNDEGNSRLGASSSSSSSSSSTAGNKGNRRDQQRQIAERRASHFARADKSSTPTGSLRRRASTAESADGNAEGTEDENGKESWPGPFNTAWSIMAKREAAKKAREEKLKQQQDASKAATMIDLDDEHLDIYDKELYTMKWEPLPSDMNLVHGYDQSIPLLSELCMRLLAKYFDYVSKESWEVLSPEQRESIGKLLSKERRFLRNEVLALSTVGTSSLLISDASLIDEETLILAIEKACGQHGSATHFETHLASLTIPSSITPPSVATTIAELDGDGKGKKGNKGKGKAAKGTEKEKGATNKGSKPATGKKRKAAKSLDNDDELGMMMEGGEDDEENEVEMDIEDETGGVTVKKSEDDEFMIHNENNHLMRLHLRYCGRGFTDRLAAAIVNHVQKLEDLVITGCYKLSDDGLIRVLHGCQQSLRRLDISCNNRISSKALHVVCHDLPSLESLILTHCNHLQDEDVLVLAENATGGQLTRLTELSLEGLQELTDDCVMRMIERFGSQLTLLNLAQLNITDEVIVALRSHCSSLQTLILNHVNDITTASLLGLFVNNPLHQSSSVASSDSIVVGGSVMASSIGSLESISFEGVITVTDDVITQLCENYGKSLKSLNLNGCNRLTDRAMIAIRMHCPSLEYLDISFVRSISENAMGLLIDHCLELKELMIWGCTQFTNRLFYGHRARGRLKIVGRVTL